MIKTAACATFPCKFWRSRGLPFSLPLPLTSIPCVKGRNDEIVRKSLLLDSPDNTSHCTTEYTPLPKVWKRLRDQDGRANTNRKFCHKYSS